MELLWDILRELGILKKKPAKEKTFPKTPKAPPPPADPTEARKRAIEKLDPRDLARNIKRMMKDK